MHPHISARDARLNIYDLIRQAKSEWKRAELSAKSMGKVSNKIFRDVVK